MGGFTKPPLIRGLSPLLRQGRIRLPFTKFQET